MESSSQFKCFEQPEQSEPGDLLERKREMERSGEKSEDGKNLYARVTAKLEGNFGRKWRNTKAKFSSNKAVLVIVIR